LLNYRDTAVIQGMYPGQKLCDSCRTGQDVVAIGEGVTVVQVGDALPDLLKHGLRASPQKNQIGFGVRSMECW